MRDLFRKAGFVFRFVWMLVCHYPRLRTEGFVFFEPGAYVRVDKGCSIVLKNRVYLKRGSILECTGGGKMVLGNHVNIGNYAYIGCRERLELDDGAAIGQCCIVLDVRHKFSKEHAIDNQGYSSGKCIVGKNCLVFPYSTVGPNVTMADDTVIANYTYVNKDIAEPRKMWGGVPVKFIKDMVYDD